MHPLEPVIKQFVGAIQARHGHFNLGSPIGQLAIICEHALVSRAGEATIVSYSPRYCGQAIEL